MPEEVAGMVQEAALQLKELNKRMDSVITQLQQINASLVGKAGEDI